MIIRQELNKLVSFACWFLGHFLSVACEKGFTLFFFSHNKKEESNTLKTRDNIPWLIIDHERFKYLLNRKYQFNIIDIVS